MEDNLYIIRVFGKNGSSVIKFGYSAKVQIRLKQYSDYNPLVEIIGTYYREDAKKFELTFHKNNKSFIRNEWYLEEQLENILYQIKNGIVLKEKFKKLVIKKKNNIKTFEIINITDKKCSHCKEIKLCNEYNKCSTTRDKLHHQCKVCRSKLRLKYKNKSREYLRNYLNNLKKVV